MNYRLFMKLLLTVALPILLGIAIYIFYGNYNHTLAGKLLPLAIHRHKAYGWLFGNFPDGLWVFSGTRLNLIIWEGNISLASILWILLPLSIACIYELLQKLHFICGTYDTHDLLAYVLGFGFALLLNHKTLTQKNI